MVSIGENLNPVEEGCRETLSPPALGSHRYFDRAVVVPWSPSEAEGSRTREVYCPQGALHWEG